MFTTTDVIRATVGAHSPERGASLVEYALLLALIAVVCIAAVMGVGINLNDNYNESTTSIFGD